MDNTLKKKKAKKPLPMSTKIRSALRQIWNYSSLKRDVLRRARKSKGVYQCEKCFTFCNNKEIQIDHIICATPPEGIIDNDWGPFIKRLLFVEPEGLMALCPACHKVKTASESELRKKTKKANKSINIQKNT